MTIRSLRKAAESLVENGHPRDLAWKAGKSVSSIKDSRQTISKCEGGIGG